MGTTTTPPVATRPRVVIVGRGFAGLYAARGQEVETLQDIVVPRPVEPGQSARSARPAAT